MIKRIIKELRIAVAALLGLVVLLCCLYPAVVWMIAQGVFPAQANGSLVTSDGRIAGSALIAQNFVQPRYFHPRPSAAGDGYDAINSGGSNLGPTSRKLIDTAASRISNYRLENNLNAKTLIPADAVTASASGLDPQISLQNALLQARRVAAARGITEDAVRKMVAAHTEGRDLWLLGEPRVNVLLLNLEMDKRK
jgi:potassium-transporting ATPase KdpC subunit